MAFTRSGEVRISSKDAALLVRGVFGGERCSCCLKLELNWLIEADEGGSFMGEIGGSLASFGQSPSARVSTNRSRKHVRFIHCIDAYR